MFAPAPAIFDSVHCEKSGQAGLAMTNHFASVASKTGFSGTGLPPMTSGKPWGMSVAYRA